MLNLERILHPTDFSATADRAFQYALALARRHGASLQIVHAAPGEEEDAKAPDGSQNPQQLLESLVDRHSTSDVEVHFTIRHGSDVPSTLVDVAVEHRSELIVMGTHGGTATNRFSMGSVAQRTLRHAPCSVLTVGPPEDASAGSPIPLEIRRILVPVDFSSFSVPQIQLAEQFARYYEAQIDLLTVVEPLPFLGIFTGVMTANDLVPNLDNRTKNELRDIWKQTSDGDVHAKLHVEEGHAAAQIVDVAEELGSDLILIAAQGHSNLERFLIGSVTERVVQAAPCPVWTAKRLASEEDSEVETKASEEPRSA